MSQSRIPSPARSLGAPVTPRRYKSRTRSVGSPARSTTSGRLSALVHFKENNKDSFVLSPAPSRRSVLNDNTDIEEPRRRSWWKNLADNSRDVMEVLNDHQILETNEAVEEYIDIEVLSQEKKNYSIDIPESSDSESISSIYIPQRKLFTQKDQGQNKFGQLIGTRETLAKLHKSHVADKSVHVAPKNLFGQGTKSRAKPVFQAGLLNLSPNKTANKTKENVAAEVKGQVRNLFGNRAGTKRKNMFADFIVSESEDEISEIQPKVFGFPKKTDMRRDSANSRGKREHSPTSSVTTDIEMDDWKMLPSSTMVENQLEDMMAAKTPVKRARLSKLTETKKSEIKSNADPVEKAPSDEEQELKYEDDDDKSEQNEKNQDQDEFDGVGNEDNNDNNLNQSNVQLQTNRSKHIKEKEMTIENIKFNQEGVQNESRGNLQNISKGKVQNLNQSKTLNVSQQKNNVSQKKLNESPQKVSKEKQVIFEEAMEVESEQEQNNRNQSQIEKNKSHKELQVSRKENTDKINEQNKDIELSDNKLSETDQLENVDNIQEDHDNNVDKVKNHEEVVENVEENNQRSKVILEQKLNKSKESAHVNIAELSDEQEINNSRKSNDASHEKSQNINEMAATEADEDDEDEELEHQEENEAQEESEVQNESDIEDQKSDVEAPENSDKEDQNESEEEIQNNSVVNEQDNESEDDIAMDDQEENEAEQNESEMEVQNESEVHNQEESENEAQNESVAEAQNESAMENEESEQEIAEDEINDSEREELEDNDVRNDSEIDNENDEAQNESEEEMQEESTEVQDEMDEVAQNKSNEDQDEIDDEAENESAEIQEDVEDEEQNESSEIQDDAEDEAQNESAEIQEETEEDAQNESHEAQEESDNEIQDSNDQQESDNEQERNETHETTGRHRKKNETKVNSPEAILHDKTNQLESFTAQGRNTSVRKTTMLKNLNIRPSLAPPRESTRLSDGTRNSSAEGSGWDSHRTTRKTLRQTFGRDFTPRKSLRALVMEKSANRQTAVNEMTSVTAKFPQANSTELPEASMVPDDSELAAEPNHDVSKHTRQTTLEMYLQKIKKQNMERKLKMEEAVKNSLKAPTRDVLNPFKVPSKPIFSTRKPNKMASKPKAKPVKSTLIPLDDLPAEVIEDMKYKPPKRFQPSNASWITKRLYKFLESKLESKYDYKARVRAEKLVETIYHFCKDLRRVDVAPVPAVDALKHEMARLDVVKTHFDFYQFFHEYMPREVRVKVVPDVVNKINVPRQGVFSDIIRGNTVQG